jgi:hypothetical protein
MGASFCGARVRLIRRRPVHYSRPWQAGGDRLCDGWEWRSGRARTLVFAVTVWRPNLADRGVDTGHRCLLRLHPAHDPAAVHATPANPRHACLSREIDRRLVVPPCAACARLRLLGHRPRDTLSSMHRVPPSARWTLDPHPDVEQHSHCGRPSCTQAHCRCSEPTSRLECEWASQRAHAGVMGSHE